MAPQYTRVLIYTSGQQITLSKAIFCVLQDERELLRIFAAKPFSS